MGDLRHTSAEFSIGTDKKISIVSLQGQTDIPLHKNAIDSLNLKLDTFMASLDSRLMIIESKLIDGNPTDGKFPILEQTYASKVKIVNPPSKTGDTVNLKERKSSASGNQTTTKPKEK